MHCREVVHSSECPLSEVPLYNILSKDYIGKQTTVEADLSTLDFGDESVVLELHPVGLVEFGSNEKVEVLYLVVFSHQSGRQPQLCVRLNHCIYGNKQYSVHCIQGLC